MRFRDRKAGRPNEGTIHPIRHADKHVSSLLDVLREMIRTAIAKTKESSSTT